MLPLGVLHTSHYRLHSAGIFFLILMYPPPVPCKKRSIRHRELPVPLQSGSIAEIDVILGSDVARGMLVCLDEACLPTQIAGRRPPWD